MEVVNHFRNAGEGLDRVDPLADFLGAALGDFVELHARDAEVLHQAGGGKVAREFQFLARQGAEPELRRQDI